MSCVHVNLFKILAKTYGNQSKPTGAAALLTHHPFLVFYFGFGFFAVVMIVWFVNWRSSDIER
jgi:hypothetical protein